MRRPLVIANWKMNMTLSDAVVLTTVVRDGLEKISGIEVIICPPAIWLTEISQIVCKDIGHLGLGAQNIYYMPNGSFTGEISAEMVRDVAKYVIVGHSERRDNFGETNAIISRKVSAALDAGLTPIVCVGEKNKSQNSAKEIVGQLQESLVGVNGEELKEIIVAYEPVWSVGSDESASPEHCAKVINQLREIVSTQTPIIYGGDVNSSNIYNFVSRPEIDGVLVGRAGLIASSFIKICRIVAEYKKII